MYVKKIFNKMYKDLIYHQKEDGRNSKLSVQLKILINSNTTGTYIALEYPICLDSAVFCVQNAWFRFAVVWGWSAVRSLSKCKICTAKHADIPVFLSPSAVLAFDMAVTGIACATSSRAECKTFVQKCTIFSK